MYRTLIALFVLTGCADERAATIAGLTGDATAGETVYADNCASCHGADGSGGSGPDLTGGSGSAAEIIDYVLYGDDEMPAFEDTLSDQEIADVTAYVQSIAAGAEAEE